ncbi:TetR/AcrR family transcriptional regulator [Methanoregula sp. UBA64]|jgi:AcrR family transcriptional regulator|uniref:TetR/AcrR family transcriptional regulator n=1 Tax=Methanoregula sp. UBA64 TaxID=1915554 RepID=UPI0025FF8E84|nr:TetR/AcrR family transcriptional regulator [Methanoregula sp. UBA64]
MARITKSPDERKAELMAIAEQLFIEKGYDHTSPSDIIRKAGIAQGTFYYYFASKDDLARAIIDRYLDRVSEYVSRVANDQTPDAPHKLLMISDALIDLSKKKMGLVGGASIDRSLGGRAEYVNQIKAKLLSVVQQIVRQGVAEGQFNTDYPDETAEILFFVSLYLNRELRNTRDPVERKKKIAASRVLMERTLGTQEGMFRSSL